MQGDMGQNRDEYGSGEGNKEGWSSAKHGGLPWAPFEVSCNSVYQ